MTLHEHCLRNVAGALRDIARTEHPDLTFEVGVLQRDGFRPFSAGTGQAGRLEASCDEAEEVLHQLKPDFPYEREKFFDDPMTIAEAKVTAALEYQPGPYVKAFRERVCPVPEFPGIKNRQEDQA